MNDQRQRFDLMEIANTVTTFILFNLLWLFGALLIVTIPALTAALFASVAPWPRGEAPYRPLATFGNAVRQYWFKATVLGLLDLLAVGFVALNLLILRQMGLGSAMGLLALIVTLAAAVLIIVTNVFAWPLLVTTDPPLRDLLRDSVRLSVFHPFWGVLVGVTAVIPVLISLFLPGFFLLTITFAAPALIVQWGAWRVIRQYVNQ